MHWHYNSIVSLQCLRSTMNHQCFREAWLFPSNTSNSSVSQQRPVHVLSVSEPHRLMTECDAAECCNCAHSWDLNKRDSVVEALDRADGSNNGALFQICCLSHRLPLTHQCRCCSTWFQLYPTSYATGYIVLLTCICMLGVSEINNSSALVSVLTDGVGLNKTFSAEKADDW